jgi:hypothetical protein
MRAFTAGGNIRTTIGRSSVLRHRQAEAAAARSGVRPAGARPHLSLPGHRHCDRLPSDVSNSNERSSPSRPGLPLNGADRPASVGHGGPSYVSMPTRQVDYREIGAVPDDRLLPTIGDRRRRRARLRFRRARVPFPNNLTLARPTLCLQHTRLTLGGLWCERTFFRAGEVHLPTTASGAHAAPGSKRKESRARAEASPKAGG